MTNEKIFTDVSVMVSEQFSIKKANVSDKTNFNKDLNADFVDLARFIVEIEDEFGDVIPDGSTEKIKTVGDLVKQIEVSYNKKKKKKVSKKK